MLLKWPLFYKKASDDSGLWLIYHSQKILCIAANWGKDDRLKFASFPLLAFSLWKKRASSFFQLWRGARGTFILSWGVVVLPSNLNKTVSADFVVAIFIQVNLRQNFFAVHFFYKSAIIKRHSLLFMHMSHFPFTLPLV